MNPIVDNYLTTSNKKIRVYLNRIFEDFIQPYFIDESQYSLAFEYDKFFERYLFTIVLNRSDEKNVKLNIGLSADFAVNFILSVKDPESKKTLVYNFGFLYELDSLSEFKEKYIHEYILKKMME